jgi:SAM-dependent methyltransferase
MTTTARFGAGGPRRLRPAVREVRASILRRLLLPATRFRRRRMRAFLDTFADSLPVRILDVGGTAINWTLSGYRGDVVLLNLVLPHDAPSLPENLTYVQGDGTRLPYPDGAFEIGFSNSVIEHLGTLENQLQFARELSRVARGLWVQTPARWFPLEPHFLAPLVHYLPHSWQRRLVRNFTPYGWVMRPSRSNVEALLDEYRLMTYREFASAFPDCEVRRERFFGLTKSYIAVRRLSRARSSAA